MKKIIEIKGCFRELAYCDTCNAWITNKVHDDNCGKCNSCKGQLKLQEVIKGVNNG